MDGALDYRKKYLHVDVISTHQASRVSAIDQAASPRWRGARTSLYSRTLDRLEAQNRRRFAEDEFINEEVVPDVNRVLH